MYSKLLLGGHVFGRRDTPASWVRAHVLMGYRAAYLPDRFRARDVDEAKIYAAAARAHGIFLAEAGAWGNPLSPDPKARKAALQYCKERLFVADETGAACCVNIAGSLGPKWDGPSPRDLTPDAFARVVDSVREIIDAVKPTRTFYTVETMPWMYPDSADSYHRLIKAVNRKALAVHFDPANLINSPEKYFRSGLVIEDFVRKLGLRIKSCHVKDVRLEGTMTTRIIETSPGGGGLDHLALLRALKKTGLVLPLMLEHMRSAAQYREAAAHLRKLASRNGFRI